MIGISSLVFPDDLGRGSGEKKSKMCYNMCDIPGILVTSSSKILASDAGETSAIFDYYTVGRFLDRADLGLPRSSNFCPRRGVTKKYPDYTISAGRYCCVIG